MMLLISCIAVGALHALVPDHWLPFSALASAKGWSTRKTAWMTFLGGLAHVGSSLVLGLAGIFLGKSLAEVTHWEGMRAGWFSTLLIGFGLTYMIWSAKRANRRKLDEKPVPGEAAYWTYFAIFVLGPCEPLIPFLFLSGEGGWAHSITLVLAFSAATLSVMTAAACFASSRIQTSKFLQKMPFGREAGAGAAIVFSGLLTKVLGV